MNAFCLHIRSICSVNFGEHFSFEMKAMCCSNVPYCSYLFYRYLLIDTRVLLYWLYLNGIDTIFTWNSAAYRISNVFFSSKNVCSTQCLQCFSIFLIYFAPPLLINIFLFCFCLNVRVYWNRILMVPNILEESFIEFYPFIWKFVVCSCYFIKADILLVIFSILICILTFFFSCYFHIHIWKIFK